MDVQENENLAYRLVNHVAPNHLTRFKIHEFLRLLHSGVSNCFLNTEIADHVFYKVPVLWPLHDKL